MSRFVVVNAILLALFGAFMIGTSSNGIRLAYMSAKDMEESTNYVTMSALMEVTINPVVFMLGMILFILVNASKQNGVAMNKARYGWGALCLCLLAFVTLMVPALMVPLMDYLGTTVKGSKTWEPAAKYWWSQGCSFRHCSCWQEVWPSNHTTQNTPSSCVRFIHFYQCLKKIQYEGCQVLYPDYEQTRGSDMWTFAANSYIEGQRPVSKQTDTKEEIQAAQDIVTGLQDYARTFHQDSKDENEELQTLKAVLLDHQQGPSHARRGVNGMIDKFNSWDDVKEFILKNKQICLNPNLKSDFARVLNTGTSTPAARALIENITETIDALTTRIHNKHPFKKVTKAMTECPLLYQCFLKLTTEDHHFLKMKIPRMARLPWTTTMLLRTLRRRYDMLLTTRQKDKNLNLLQRKYTPSCIFIKCVLYCLSDNDNNYNNDNNE